MEQQTTAVTVNRTTKPIVGGILSIVAGGCALMAVFGLIIAIIAVKYGYGYYLMHVNLAQAVLSFIAVCFFIVGVMSVIGGIYALQRRYWGVAIAGAITAVFSCFPLGIAAVILTAISRDEFSR